MRQSTHLLMFGLVFVVSVISACSDDGESPATQTELWYLVLTQNGTAEENGSAETRVVLFNRGDNLVIETDTAWYWEDGTHCYMALGSRLDAVKLVGERINDTTWTIDESSTIAGFGWSYWPQAELFFSKESEIYYLPSFELIDVNNNDLGSFRIEVYRK